MRTSREWQHPWLRVSLLSRAILSQQWGAKAWQEIKPEMAKVFLTVGVAILAMPLAGDAQQTGKVFRIGLMLPGSASSYATRIEAFRRGLRDLSYVEGQNLTIESRTAEGKYYRLPSLAAELVRLKVDVIVAATTPPALAAKATTTTIPIVFVDVGDPVGSGLVASLARPGENITGLSDLSPELSGKRLELRKEGVPGVARVAVLWRPAHPLGALLLRETRVAARRLGVELQPLEVRDPNDFEGAFGAATRGRAAALKVLDSPFFTKYRARIVDLATESRLPVMYGFREFVDAGGFMSYGTNLLDLYRRAAHYADKILKGAKPADLPVEQPSRFELLINLRTAKALGLTIPPSVLMRADEVIQ